MKKMKNALALVFALVLAMGLGAMANAADPVAKIGDREYATLQEAINAAENVSQPTVITLIRDVADGSGLATFAANNGSKNILIDFDGHSYTMKNPAVGSSGTETQAMHFEKGSKVYLKNGTFSVASDAVNVKMLMQCYCDMTFENMTINLEEIPLRVYSFDEDSPYYEEWNGRPISLFNFNYGTSVIKGNTTLNFNSDDPRGISVSEGSSSYPGGATLTIESGVTVNGLLDVEENAHLILKGGTFKADPINYVAEGYKTVQIGDSYVVVDANAVAMVGTKVYSTLPEAIADAEDGATITLLSDTNETAVLEVTKSLTINGNGHTINSTATRILWIDASNVTVTLKNTKFIGDSVNTERGVQVNPDLSGVALNIENCTIDGITHYAINICSDTSVALNITNSTIKSWGALNLWGDNYVVNVENSTLIGVNDKAYNADGWNDFGTVILEGDTTGKTDEHVENCVVNLKNCDIQAQEIEQTVNGETVSNKQYAIVFNNPSAHNVVNVSGSNTKFAYNKNQMALIQGSSNCLNFDDVTLNSPVQIEDGTITINSGTYNGTLESSGSGSILLNGGKYRFNPRTMTGVTVPEGKNVITSNGMYIFVDAEESAEDEVTIEIHLDGSNSVKKVKKGTLMEARASGLSATNFGHWDVIVKGSTGEQKSQIYSNPYIFEACADMVITNTAKVDDPNQPPAVSENGTVTLKGTSSTDKITIGVTMEIDGSTAKDIRYGVIYASHKVLGHVAEDSELTLENVNANSTTYFKQETTSDSLTGAFNLEIPIPSGVEGDNATIYARGYVVFNNGVEELSPMYGAPITVQVGQ